MLAQALERRTASLCVTRCRSRACLRQFSATPLFRDADKSNDELDGASDFFSRLRDDHASSSSTSKLPGMAENKVDDDDEDAFATPASFGVPGMGWKRSSPASARENPFSLLADADRTDETYERLAAAQPNKWSGSSLRAFATPSPEPPRIMRGVHRPRERALGNTPSESANFHAAIRKIFDDLSRTSGSSSTNMSAPTSDPYSSQFSPGFGVRSGRGALGMQRALGGAGFGPGYGHGLGGRGNTAMDPETLMRFDELKDELGLLGTDAEVLEWAKEFVFRKVDGADGIEEYPAVYPHILALTLRTLRTNFDNPHLALALFNHAQTLSLESYMSGCLTTAYNEVIIIRWDCFRDLEGVEQAIREMDVIGVMWDKITRKTVQGVCEEVSRNLRSPAYSIDEIAKTMEKRWQALEKRLQVDMRRELVIDSAKKKESSSRAKRGDRVSLRNKPRWAEDVRAVEHEQRYMGMGEDDHPRPPSSSYGL